MGNAPAPGNVPRRPGVSRARPSRCIRARVTQPDSGAARLCPESYEAKDEYATQRVSSKAGDSSPDPVTHFPCLSHDFLPLSGGLAAKKRLFP